MQVVCAACGADLTVAAEHWNNASVLRPLESIEVMPCCSCMSLAASEADGGPMSGLNSFCKQAADAVAAMENDEHQRESAENGGLGR